MSFAVRRAPAGLQITRDRFRRVLGTLRAFVELTMTDQLEGELLRGYGVGLVSALSFEGVPTAAEVELASNADAERSQDGQGPPVGY